MRGLSFLGADAGILQSAAPSSKGVGASSPWADAATGAGTVPSPGSQGAACSPRSRALSHKQFCTLTQADVDEILLHDLGGDAPAVLKRVHSVHSVRGKGVRWGDRAGAATAYRDGEGVGGGSILVGAHSAHPWGAGAEAAADFSAAPQQQVYHHNPTFSIASHPLQNIGSFSAASSFTSRGGGGGSPSSSSHTPFGAVPLPALSITHNATAAAAAVLVGGSPRGAAAPSPRSARRGSCGYPTSPAGLTAATPGAGLASPRSFHGLATGPPESVVRLAGPGPGCAVSAAQFQLPDADCSGPWAAADAHSSGYHHSHTDLTSGSSHTHTHTHTHTNARERRLRLLLNSLTSRSAAQLTHPPELTRSGALGSSVGVSGGGAVTGASSPRTARTAPQSACTTPRSPRAVMTPPHGGVGGGLSRTQSLRSAHSVHSASVAMHPRSGAEGWTAQHAQQYTQQDPESPLPSARSMHSGPHSMRSMRSRTMDVQRHVGPESPLHSMHSMRSLHSVRSMRSMTMDSLPPGVAAELMDRVSSATVELQSAAIAMVSGPV